MIHRLFALGLVLLIAFRFAADNAAEDASASLAGGKMTVLFDGESLEGWRGRDDLWSVADGAIVGTTTDDKPIKGNTFLVNNAPVEGDFELTLQYKIEGGNSGVQYLSAVIDEQTFVVSGYQADIDSTGRFTGILYEEKGRGILATRGQDVTIGSDGKKSAESFADADEMRKAFRDDGWNDYRILVRGNHLQHFINGVKTVDVTDEQTEKAATQGVIALQLHRGPAMTVRFKNLVLRTW